MKPMCYECDKRYPGCHALCYDYAAFRAETDRIRTRRQEERASREQGNLKFRPARRKGAKR